MNPRPAVLQLLALAALIAAQPARAGEVFDATTFRPASGGDGIAGVEGARVPNVHDQVVDLKLWVIGDHAPVLLGQESIANRVRAVLAAQVKLTEGLAVGLQVPVVINQSGWLSGGFGTTGKPQSGFGDLRITPRIGLLNQAAHGLNIALQGSFTLPLASSGTLAGQANPQIEGLVSLSHTWGDIKDAHVEVIANALVGNRDSITVGATQLGGPYVAARIGIASYLGEELFRRVFAELEARAFTSPFGSSAGTPGEGRAGVTLCFGRFISLDLAAGSRLGSAVGSPDWSLMGALGYSPATCRTTAPTPPAAGAATAEAAPPAKLEDPAAKKAAAEAAAKKAAEEQAAADKAAADKAAAEAAAKAAAEKASAEAAAAKAAAEAEAEAATKDTDGDGVPDRIDNCPTEKGPASNFGCPLNKKQKVTVRDGKIELLDRVLFAPGKAQILKPSFPLLDQVQTVLKGHPELDKVEVQGHTDSVGVPAKNLKLSEDRAQAVLEYLVKKGVARDTLAAKGYGDTQPIADNKTKAGQEKNRRVEFKVTGMKKASAQ